MREGYILKYFISNQKKSIKQIAHDLGMSRRNLYDLYTSKILKPETKEKFETYFTKEIFSGENFRHSKEAFENREENYILDKDLELTLSEHIDLDKYDVHDKITVLKTIWDTKEQECIDLRERIAELKETIATQKELIAELKSNTGQRQNTNTVAEVKH